MENSNDNPRGRWFSFPFSSGNKSNETPRPLKAEKTLPAERTEFDLVLFVIEAESICILSSSSSVCVSNFLFVFLKLKSNSAISSGSTSAPPNVICGETSDPTVCPDGVPPSGPVEFNDVEPDPSSSESLPSKTATLLNSSKNSSLSSIALSSPLNAPRSPRSITALDIIFFILSVSIQITSCMKHPQRVSLKRPNLQISYPRMKTHNNHSIPTLAKTYQTGYKKLPNPQSRRSQVKPSLHRQPTVHRSRPPVRVSIPRVAGTKLVRTRGEIQIPPDQWPKTFYQRTSPPTAGKPGIN
mmetsp:Transcript_2799/g.4038  ORF Transcript_2799/g.4038 Transcript_2799/m.4038 type:complete len:298 (-) Transcript_2799:75-968(-)